MHRLVEWVVHWARTPWGPWALGLLAFAESSFFPIPPDVLLIALGVLRPSSALWYAAISTIGSVAGGVFGYVIGRTGGRPVASRLMPDATFASVERLYHKYDSWAVFIAGFTPIPYKLFTIAAGIFHLDLRTFVIASALSRGARFFLIGVALFAFGDAIAGYLRRYLNVCSILFVVLLIAGFWLISHWVARSARHQPTPRKPS